MRGRARAWWAGSAIAMVLVGCGAGTAPNGAAAPEITSSPPTSATMGVPFEYTLTARGMTPMGFSVLSGPEGFEIHRGAGVVRWTPQSLGTASIELEARNLAGRDTQAFEVEVVPRDGPVFTTDPPTEATVGAPYAYDPRVIADGAVAWSAPAAPDGMTVDPETGAVRWTPERAQEGTHAVTIRATEIESERFTDQSFEIEVDMIGGPAVITSMAPGRVYQGERWRYDATAAGAPLIQWSLQPPLAGSPAQGVQLVTQPAIGATVIVEWDTTGVAPGDYVIALQADNGLGPASLQAITVTVDPRPPVPEIDLTTAPPPPSVFVGATYRYDVDLTPQTDSPGVVWSLQGDTVPGELGITIDPGTGEVEFVASEAHGELQYRYTVRAENALGEGDEATISVDAVLPPAAPVIAVVPATGFTIEVGEPFPGAQVSATGQPTPVLSISGALPSFIEFDPRTGLLGPSTSKPAPDESDLGSYVFDVVATNEEGEDRATIDIVVLAAPPRVDSITPAAGRGEADVPVVVRGGGFVAAADPQIWLELGDHREALPTTFVGKDVLSATVPVDPTRPPGVYDVVVDQGSVTVLTKRFTVTQGVGTTWTGRIDADVTLRAADNPHVLTGSLRVENGATLRLEPGAVVMMPANTDAVIDVGVASAGALSADGGQPGTDDQIVVTRLQDVGGPAPVGHHRGLRFGAYNMAAATLLRNVVVEFGGRHGAATERGAVEVFSGAAPRIAESIVRESFNYGLYAQADVGATEPGWFVGNQLTANARSPISIGSNDVSTLGPELALEGNVDDRIFVRGATVSRALAPWANHGIPYFLSAGLFVRSGSTMTIAPGAQLRFAPDRGLRVASDTEEAVLVASGTPDAPITLVADGAPWSGVFFDGLVGAGTVLRHVRATGLAGGPQGALRIDRPAVEGARTVIVENTLWQSETLAAVGVALTGPARMLSFENNVIDVPGLSVDAPLVGFGDVLRTSNRYEAPLQVRAGTVRDLQQTWSRPRASDSSTQPIRPTGNLSIIDGSLRIEAGNRIEMPLNAQLAFTDSRLAIEGTADDPVVVAPASGVSYWNRIQLRGASSSGASELAHVMIQSAGSDPALGASPQRAAIVVEASATRAATPSIHDTSIAGSNGYGITFGDGTHCGGECTNNAIFGSRFSAFRMWANGVGRFGTGNLLGGNNTSGTLGHEGVWVVGDVIDTSAVWPANDVPYVVQGDIELRQSSPLDPIPMWTIEPGTELRFASGRRLRVGQGNEGVLDARGTETAPITFTSIDAASSVFWRGIDLSQGADGSVFDEVIVSYGGLDAGTGNLNFRSGSIVDVRAVRLTHSASYAATVYAGSAPMFAGPATDRVYASNGQLANPGPGDPAFDCVRDATSGICSLP